MIIYYSVQTDSHGSQEGMVTYIVFHVVDVLAHIGLPLRCPGRLGKQIRLPWQGERERRDLL